MGAVMDDQSDRDDLYEPASNERGGRGELVEYGTAVVAQAVVGAVNVAVAAWQFGRDMRALIRGLVRVTEPGGPLDRIADLADELRPLVRDVNTLGDSRAVTQLAESLERLAVLNDSVARLAESFDRLGRLGEALPKLADRLAMLPEMVSVARDVERRVGQVGSRLESLGGLAGTIGDLQQSVRMLGGTIEPLQGTAERVGRLIERARRAPRTPEEPGEPD
jgi:methyl-accepting chemotaxis protein